MISIAICDDNRDEINRIRNYLEKSQKELQKEDTIEIHYYASSAEVRDKVRNGVIYNIYILDVDMPEIGGIELAEYIHQKKPSAIVFFLTSHMEYASEGYKVKAVRYVYKEKMQEQLLEAIQYAIEQFIENKSRFITFAFNKEYYRVDVSDIIYVQRVGRQLEVHITGRPSIIESGTLRELYDRLQDRRFVFIERGSFVNLNYVYKVSKRCMQLTDGTELVISRRLITDIKEKIIELWNTEL